MAGFGETLHQARAHLGVTLKEAEQATRINRHHLAALEEENFAALPPLIYQRGIVRNYATFLQLDPGKLLAMFDEAHGIAPARSGGPVADLPPVNMPNHWAPNFAIIAFAVVLSAIVFAWVYSAFVAQPESSSTPTAAVPTATPFENDLPLPTAPPTTPEPTAPPTQTAEPTATGAADGRTSTRRAGGDNRRGGESAAETPASDSEPTQAPEPEAEPTAPPAAIEGTGATSYAVQANGADIEVTITVDGAVAFEGTVSDGDATDQFAGSSFQIVSSAGASTQFVDACGKTFTMGDAAGEATYNLDADQSSCDPAT